MTKVAAIAFTATSDPDVNRREVVAHIEAAASRGATIVVFPEASASAIPEPGMAAHGEALNGPFVNALCEASAAMSVAVVAGMFCGRTDSALVENTVVAIERGVLVGTYVKIHNFDAYGHRESDWAIAGRPVATTVELCGLRIGLMTCYDLRFGELTIEMANAGVDAIAVGAAWVAGPTKLDQFTTLVRARALDAQAFVIAAAQGGPNYCGGTTIVGPTGQVLAGGGDDLMAIADIDRSDVVAFRHAVPLRSHRRVTIE